MLGNISRTVSLVLSSSGSLPRNCQTVMANCSADTMETEEIIFMDEEATRLSPALLMSFTVALSLLITIGVIGNLIVIFALFRTRAHNATTTNAYILNLSIADLLFLIFCVPFQGTVYILNDWPFGNAMCKAAHYCQYYTMYASIWLLTTMSIDRYLAIGHPLRSVDWRSPDQAARICLCVWSVSAVCAIPWLILYSTKDYTTHGHANVTGCFDQWSQSTYGYRKWLFFGVVMVGFVIPSTIIFCMAILVARSIRLATEHPLLRASNSALAKRTDSSDSTAIGPSTASEGRGSRSDAGTVTKRRKRVVYLVFALALIFIGCWFPQNFTSIWQNFHSDILNSMRRNYRAYFVVKLISHILTYINSSINPILYSLASGQFRSRLSHALFNNGSFFQHTASNRARLGTIPTCNNGQGGTNDTGNTFARSKAGSFQPLLNTANHSRVDDDVGTSVAGPGSRRSSRGLNQLLTAQTSSPAHRASLSAKDEVTVICPSDGALPLTVFDKP